MFSSIKKAIESFGRDAGKANEPVPSAAVSLEWGAFAGVRPENIKQMELPRDKVLPEKGLVNAKCAGANLADCYIKVGREERPLDAYLLGLSDTELSAAVAGLICDTNTVWSSRSSINAILQERIMADAVKVYNRSLPGLDLTNTCIPSMPVRPSPDDLNNGTVWQPTPQGVERVLGQVSSGLKRVIDWCKTGLGKLFTKAVVSQDFGHDTPELAGGGKNSPVTPAAAPGAASAVVTPLPSPDTRGATPASTGGGSVTRSESSASAIPATTLAPHKDASLALSFISPFHEELYNKAKTEEEKERKGVAKGSPMMGTKDYPHLQSRLYDASNLPTHRQIDPDLVADTAAEATERRRKAAEQSLKTFAARWNEHKAALHKEIEEAKQKNFFGVNDSQFQERVRQADNVREAGLLDHSKKCGSLEPQVTDIEALREKQRSEFAGLPQNVDPYDFLRRAQRIEGAPLPTLPKQAASSPAEALKIIGLSNLAQAVESQSLPTVLEELESQVQLLTAKQLEIQAKYEHGMSQLEMLSSPDEPQRRVTMYKGGYDELTANYRQLLEAQVEFVVADFLGSHFTHEATVPPKELAYLQRAKEFFQVAPEWEQDKLDDVRLQADIGDTIIMNEKGSADEWWVHGFIPPSFCLFSDSQLEQARAAGVPYNNAFGFVVDKSQLVEEATEFTRNGRWLEKKLDPLGLIGMRFGNYAEQMPLMTNRFIPLYLQIGVSERERYKRPQFYTEVGSLMGKTEEAAQYDHAVHAYRSWDIARHRGVPASLWSIMEQFALISKQSAEFYLGCRYSVCMNKQLELGLPSAYVDYFARDKDGHRYFQSESEIPDPLRNSKRYAAS